MPDKEIDENFLIFDGEYTNLFKPIKLDYKCDKDFYDDFNKLKLKNKNAKQRKSVITITDSVFSKEERFLNSSILKMINDSALLKDVYFIF